MNPDTEEPRNKIVLYGCESHKSIRQSCLDLLAKGYKVTLVEDALGFKNQMEHKSAIKNMIASGA